MSPGTGGAKGGMGTGDGASTGGDSTAGGEKSVGGRMDAGGDTGTGGETRADAGVPAAGDTVRAWLSHAIARLRQAGIEDPARDARLLMAHALGLDPGRLSLVTAEPLQEPGRFEALIQRRLAFEPVSRILGQRAFYGRSFTVTPDVLDPRPETELLVDLALEHPIGRVLDLGTGSGCILLTLLAESPLSRGIGTDLSAGALVVAAGNAARLGLQDRCRFRQGDWFQALAGDGDDPDAGPAGFDLIVSNPPYIALAEMPDLAPDVRLWDPAGALTDHADGYAAYRRILAGIGAHLRPGGRLLVEIGWTQSAGVMALFAGAGLETIACHADLAGHPRVISGRRPAPV